MDPALSLLQAGRSQSLHALLCTLHGCLQHSSVNLDMTVLARPATGDLPERLAVEGVMLQYAVDTRSRSSSFQQSHFVLLAGWPSVCLSTCLSVCLPVCQSVCLSVRPSVCLSFCSIGQCKAESAPPAETLCKLCFDSCKWLRCQSDKRNGSAMCTAAAYIHYTSKSNTHFEKVTKVPTCI